MALTIRHYIREIIYELSLKLRCVGNAAENVYDAPLNLKTATAQYLNNIKEKRVKY